MSKKIKKYKMSAKKWRSMYAQRGPKGLTYVELYYKSPDLIIVNHKMNLLGKLVITLTFPIMVIITLLMHGLDARKDIKDYSKELYRYIILSEPFDKSDFRPQHDKHWDIISGIVGEYPNKLT